MDFTFGYWNVLTLNRPGALESLLDVVDGYKIDVTAIQEINWTGQGSVERNNHTVYYSCDDTSPIFGTGFVVTGIFRRFAMDFKPISPRLCSIRIKSRFYNYTLVSCHAPTEASNEHEKKEFYESLENIIKSSPAGDIKIIVGDFDAQVGKEIVHPGINGKYSLHDCSNDNGCRLINFCASQNFTIGSTIFPHKNIHKGTWYSPDGLTVTQVDHLLISAEHRYTLLDVRSFRGANFASDHYLSSSKVRSLLHFYKNRKGKQIKKNDTNSEEPSKSQNNFVDITNSEGSLSVGQSNPVDITTSEEPLSVSQNNAVDVTNLKDMSESQNKLIDITNLKDTSESKNKLVDINLKDMSESLNLVSTTYLEGPSESQNNLVNTAYSTDTSESLNHLVDATNMKDTNES